MTVCVTLDHLSTIEAFGSKPGFCRRGARHFFATHQLDWDAFRHHGIDSDALLATGDAMAEALVKHAEHMEASRGRR